MLLDQDFPISHHPGPGKKHAGPAFRAGAWKGGHHRGQASHRGDGKYRLRPGEKRLLGGGLRLCSCLYPGTGDIFASVLTGGMLTGDSLPMAMDRASRFVELAIKTSLWLWQRHPLRRHAGNVSARADEPGVPHRYHIFCAPVSAKFNRNGMGLYASKSDHTGLVLTALLRRCAFSAPTSTSGFPFPGGAGSP